MVYEQNYKLICLDAKLPNKGISVYFTSFYGTSNDYYVCKMTKNHEMNTSTKVLKNDAPDRFEAQKAS